MQLQHMSSASFPTLFICVPCRLYGIEHLTPHGPLHLLMDWFILVLMWLIFMDDNPQPQPEGGHNIIARQEMHYMVNIIWTTCDGGY